MSEPPAFTLAEIRTVAARLEPYDWPWARANADAIARNWERRCAERSGLFDGTVLLACGCEVRDGVCEVEFFATRYSRFIAFLDAGSPDPAVENAFAATVPRTADGAVLLGRMASHTANAGQVYFPCGTPDPDDVREDGSVDLAGSAEREFEEETGLAYPPDVGDTPWTLVRAGGHLALLRQVQLFETAEALTRVIESHWARQARPELDRIVTVREASDIDPARMPAYARAYLADLFRD